MHNQKIANTNEPTHRYTKQTNETNKQTHKTVDFEHSKILTINGNEHSNCNGDGDGIGNSNGKSNGQVIVVLFV